jgi:hypothetical protein
MIGEGLIRAGAMTRKQVEAILRRQKAGDSRLFGEIAIELGYVDDRAIIDYLGLKKKQSCEYHQSCHFYSMRRMTPASRRLKELYCDQWPEKCAIYRQRRTGGSVAITLWPTGRLESA